jgi:metal-sulfur cluster biosynthetic enzyme
MPTKDEVVEALRAVEDPELGMDIVDLGLLYDVEVDGPKVKVIHSLTSMGCPAGPMIQEDIVNVASAVEGVEEVEIELTWEPPWTPERMSDDAKFILGFGKRPKVRRLWRHDDFPARLTPRSFVSRRRACRRRRRACA